MRPDLSLDEFEPFEDEPSRLSRIRRGLSTAIGACVAVALLVGLGVWFYRLGARDAENVPIIRASTEPAKTRPDDPGGAVAPHQDITSYSVAESKPAQATAAVIAPPPPEPKREDVAMGTLPPEPIERPATPAPPVSATQPRVGQSTADQPAPLARPTAAEAAAAIASGAVRARAEASRAAEPEPAPARAETPEGGAVLALAETPVAGATAQTAESAGSGGDLVSRTGPEPAPAESVCGRCWTRCRTRRSTRRR